MRDVKNDRILVNKWNAKQRKAVVGVVLEVVSQMKCSANSNKT